MLRAARIFRALRVRHRELRATPGCSVLLEPWDEYGFGSLEERAALKASVFSPDGILPNPSFFVLHIPNEQVQCVNGLFSM